MVLDPVTQHRAAPIEAYLSSTLAHESDIARKALEGCIIRERPRDIDAIEPHLEELARSHVYVGIVGWTGGQVSREGTVSIMELEYERARAAGLLRLLFLQGPGVVESGSALKQVVAFRRHLLSSGDATAVFTNDSELRDLLRRAIANLRSTREASPILTGDDIRIFVSYRRTDSQVITGRLCDRLKQEFGSGRVFVDIDDIPVGEDFVDHIRATLKQCNVILAVIGKKWRGPRGGGASRLDEVNDFVRMELSVALADSIRIVPISIDGAKMPAPADLPEDVRRLATLQAAPLDTGKDFHSHVTAIIAAVRRLFVEGAERRFWAEAAATASSGPRAAAEGFTVSYFSSDIQYQCRSCGFTSWIDKLEWFRDGDRPPEECLQCGGQGYRE